MLVCEKCNSIETVKILIDAGADVNAINSVGKTSLMMASMNCNSNRVEIVKMLIIAGADVNIKMNDGQTALMIKCTRFHSNIKIANLLIDAGADVNAKYRNRTILMILLMANRPSYSDVIIELLYTSSETLLDKDNDGKTAYDYYIQHGYNTLDTYHLQILKGDISPSNIKSARFC